MKPGSTAGSAISSEEVNFLVFRYLQESGEPSKTNAGGLIRPSKLCKHLHSAFIHLLLFLSCLRSAGAERQAPPSCCRHQPKLPRAPTGPATSVTVCPHTSCVGSIPFAGFAHSAFTFAYESQITKSSVADAQVNKLCVLRPEGGCRCEHIRERDSTTWEQVSAVKYGLETIATPPTSLATVVE